MIGVVVCAGILVDSKLSSAWAQDADDDVGGDDDDGDDDGGGAVGGGGVGGGGAGGGGAVGGAGAPGAFDDGDNAGPSDADDCFAEIAVRPSWLRNCIRPRPPAVSRPATVARPAGPPPSRVANAGGSASRTRPVGEPALADPARIIPREVVLFDVTEQQLLELQSRGFVIVLRSTALGVTLVRVRVPRDLSTRSGLAEAQRIAPTAISDFNHIYGIYRPGSGRRETTGAAWPAYPGGCTVPATIAIIDTPVDPTSPGLVGQGIEVINVVAAGRQPASSLHGTAIAALISGRSDAPVPGLLTKSRLVAVSAFHKAADGEDIGDSYDITVAIDTALSRNIKVINSSFAGPANRILEKAVSVAASRGARLIASTGNAGPGSPPLYPAAYDDAIAVTGVAADERVYRLAIRGAHVDLAGPGVDVPVVSVRAEQRFETGTSFATPFISAAIAAAIAREPNTPIEKIIESLQKSARDLGAPGRDSVFGWGLILAGNVCP
ncbi:MAG: S8 family serine peptidase [Hyphomicrobium aestuarii]|nr:S8 family serine peptidase [Hyphomicrobium aestuarii]